jgi:hypothetical protein
MQTLFYQQSEAVGLQVTFPYFPKYSPKLNGVEDVIHLIGQKGPHHGHYKKRLEAVEKKLVDHLH